MNYSRLSSTRIYFCLSFCLIIFFSRGLQSPLLVDFHPNGFLELRLNRPSKYNSLDTELLMLIHNSLDNFVGVAKGILICAEGRAFCAGGDIKHVSILSNSREKVLTNILTCMFEVFLSFLMNVILVQALSRLFSLLSNNCLFYSLFRFLEIDFF